MKSNDEIYNTFCGSVRKLMQENGIQNKTMAKLLGMSDAMFSSKLNNHETKFNFEQILRLAHELAESVEDLSAGNV